MCVRFSNYEARLSDSTHSYCTPSAQVVWPGQEILNGDVVVGFLGIQKTSGFLFGEHPE